MAKIENPPYAEGVGNVGDGEKEMTTTANESTVPALVLSDSQLGWVTPNSYLEFDEVQEDEITLGGNFPPPVIAPRPEPDDLSHLIEQEGIEPRSQEEIEAGLAREAQSIITDTILNLAQTLSGTPILLDALKGMKRTDADKHEEKIVEFIITKGVAKTALWFCRVLTEQLLKKAIPDYGMTFKNRGIDPVQYFKENLKGYFLLLDLPVSSMRAVAPTLNNHFDRHKITKKDLLAA